MMAQGMVRRFLGKACLSRAIPALLMAACPAVRGASIMSGTYVGGGLEDVCAVVATDGGGNVYVAGHTGSSGWVGGGGDTTQNGQRDAFVVKFSPSGDHLWSTFLGGESEDDASGIALDGAGNVLVSGSTSSSGWVSGGWDVVRNRGWDGDPQWPRDGFVAKLSPAGAHVWSSYLGGANDELAHDIAVDAWGGVCVVGATVSPGWVSGGWRPVFGGSVWEDGFLVKLSSAGAHQWSTFMGGGGRRLCAQCHNILRGGHSCGRGHQVPRLGFRRMEHHLQCRRQRI